RECGGPLDAHLTERPGLSAANAEVGQLETQCLQSGPKGLDEAVGEHKKKRGPNFARFTGRNLATRERLSSTPWGARSGHGQSCIGDHAPVASAGRAVRKEVLAVVRAAPGGERDRADP